MIRSVSKEDYLLARGANPRTGMITPGIHSANSSFDEATTLRARGIAPPSKWGQRGNEWISLGLDQPTPVGTPPCPLPPPGANGLRTPRRLNSDMPPPQVETAPVVEESQVAVRSPHSQQADVVVTPTGFPGTYPQTPQDVNQHAVQQNARIEHVIRRKPVGSTPTKTTPGNDGVLQQPKRSIEFRPQIPGLEPSARSSSAPTPQRPQPFCPADVGKDLPAIPNDANVKPPCDSDPFLDQRPDLQARVHSFGTSNISGRSPQEKGLPCLPMSNGPSQFPDPSLNVNTLARQPPPLKYLPRPQGPRGGVQMEPYSSVKRPRQPQAQMPKPLRGQPRGGRPMPVPVYDNPPAPPQGRDPVLMQHPDMVSRRTHPRRMNAQVPRPGPFTTISTSTSMYTDMPLPPARFPRTRPGLMPMQQTSNKMEPFPSAMSWKPRHHTHVSMSMNSEDLMSMQVSKTRPLGSSRPHMPGRAEAMHNIHQVNPIATPVTDHWTHTVPPSQSNLTGTPFISRVSDVVEGEMHQPQVFKQHTVGLPPESSTSVPNMLPTLRGLSRKCSRCSNGFVTDQQRNTGQAAMSAAELRECTLLTTLDEQMDEAVAENRQEHAQSTQVDGAHDEPFSDFQRGSKDTAEVDERDHTICCQECCKEQDCHEGCLGHPSPAPSPTRSGRPSTASLHGGNATSTTAREAETPSIISEKARKSRLGFVKHAFKRSIDKDRTPKSTPTTPTTKPAQPEGPFVELAALPLSPATFWGGDGAGVTFGAVEAAEVAMKGGGDMSSDDVAAAVKTVISRKERRKKPKAGEISATAVTPGSQTGGSQRVVSSNEGRRVTSVPTIRLPTPASSVKTQNRNASGASVATIEIPVPGFGNLGLGSLWELIVVPLEATRMWIRNHPQVMILSWSVLERGWDMGQIMTITGSRLWGVVFVYSKTGKLRLKKGDSAGTFIFDCARSVVYLLIFMGLGVCVMRMLAWILSMLRIGVVVCGGVAWMVKKLLGQGLLW